MRIKESGLNLNPEPEPKPQARVKESGLQLCVSKAHRPLSGKRPRHPETEHDIYWGLGFRNLGLGFAAGRTKLSSMLALLLPLDNILDRLRNTTEIPTKSLNSKPIKM